jgi:CRP-like cAMP-binding protein
MSHIEVLIRKLRSDTRIDGEDIAAIQLLPLHVREVSVQTSIVRVGDRPNASCLLIKGFACRSKIADIGKRQILSFHVPGDIPDLQSLFLKTMDHDLITISDATLGFIEHTDILKLINKRPTVAHALWRETLIDASIFREWIMNLGVRDAASRMAHLFAELHHRLAAVGLVDDDGKFDFPVTQSELAEAVGTSSVHVNRVLQKFRTDGVLDIRKNVARLDLEKVIALSGFDPAYLHHVTRQQVQ